MVLTPKRSDCMYKRSIVVLLLAMCGMAAFAQNPPRVVVLPLENRAGEQYEKDAETLTEILSTFINETLRLNVIDRFALDAAMAARRWRMADWADNAKTGEMGRTLNASYIVRGTMTTLGNSLIISARILDIATAEVRGSTNTQLENLAEAYSKLNSMAQLLTYNLGLPIVQQAQPVQTVQPVSPPPEPAQQPSATPAYTNPDDEWKQKWFYLGPTLAGGYLSGFTTDYSYYSGSGGIFSAGVIADLSLAKFFSITARLLVGSAFYDFAVYVPLLLRFGGKPGKVEITGNIGLTLGYITDFTLGITYGATLGFKAGRAGIFFFGFDYMVGLINPGYMIAGYAGIKFGMGNHNW